MARKNALISTALDGAILSFNVNGAGEFSLNVDELDGTVRREALVHGLRQKISDAAAISRDVLPDDPAAAAKMKFDAMADVADRLRSGEWNARKGDGSAPVAGIIYRAFEAWAMARAAEKGATLTPEQCRASYDNRDRAGQFALRKVPAIAEIIERMKAERGGSDSVDADAILADLGI